MGKNSTRERIREAVNERLNEIGIDPADYQTQIDSSIDGQMKNVFKSSDPYTKLDTMLSSLAAGDNKHSKKAYEGMGKLVQVIDNITNDIQQSAKKENITTQTSSPPKPETKTKTTKTADSAAVKAGKALINKGIASHTKLASAADKFRAKRDPLQKLRSDMLGTAKKLNKVETLREVATLTDNFGQKVASYIKNDDGSINDDRVQQVKELSSKIQDNMGSDKGMQTTADVIDNIVDNAESAQVYNTGPGYSS